MTILIQDLRYALRSFRRASVFSAIAIATVALGVGGTTTVFSVVNALLLRPLPVDQPDQVLSVQESRSAGLISMGAEGMRMPYVRYEAYEEATTSLFTGLAAHRSMSVSARLDDLVERVTGTFVSANYFQVLGVRPALGRFFENDDELSVVVHDLFWRSRLGADPNAIGRTIHIDGVPMTVVGVTPPGFGGLILAPYTQAWVPARASSRFADATSLLAGVGIFGRLRPGVGPEAASAAISAIASRIPSDQDGAVVDGAALETFSGVRGEDRREVAVFLGLLLAAAMSVLLIGAANIAGMLLSRAVARHREVAVRLAIGAGAGRLVRQFLTESVLLFVLGGVGGVAIAYWGTALIAKVPLPIDGEGLVDFSPDPGVLAFALTLAAVTGIAFGLLPALRAARPGVIDALKGGDSAGALRMGRGRGAFVITQLALVVVLASSAGLVTRSLQKALGTDPGFSHDNVVVAVVDLGSRPGYDEERGRAFFSLLRERVEAMPAARSVSFAQIPLMTGTALSTQFRAGTETDVTPRYSLYNYVDAEYLGIMGIDLVAGRGIAESDRSGSPPRRRHQ